VFLGMLQFSDDNNGVIGHNYAANRWSAMDWPLGVDSYLGGEELNLSYRNIFRSKASPAFYGCSTTNEEKENTNAVFDIDYGIPSRGGSIGSYVGYNHAIIEQSSKSIILADCYENDAEPYRGRSTMKLQAYDSATGFSNNKFKHGKMRGNYMFFDGHGKGIKWVPEGDFRAKYTYDLDNLPNIGLGGDTITYTP